MVSHYASNGIRRPLNSAYIGLKRLQEEMEAKDDDWDKVEKISAIRDSCRSAVAVLDDLAVFDRLEDGVTDRDMQYVDAWSFIRDAVRPFHVLARQIGVDVRLELSPEVIATLEGLCLRVDKVSMGQVLRAVLDRAVKNTPSGGRVLVFVKKRNSRRSTSADLHSVNIDIHGDTEEGLPPPRVPPLVEGMSSEKSWHAVSARRLAAATASAAAAVVSSGGGGVGLGREMLVVRIVDSVISEVRQSRNLSYGCVILLQ